MASNVSIDQQRLIDDENDHSSKSGADTYGSFASGAGELPPTTTTTSSYPYALGSSQPTVIYLGGCPACKTGMLESDFTSVGLCWAIFLFPIGILCCLALRQRRCNFCGSVYD